MNMQTIDWHSDTIGRAVHYETSLDIVSIRLKAALNVRTTLEGLQESIRFTLEYIERMKEQQS
jgi:hypothetical protein